MVLISNMKYIKIYNTLVKVNKKSSSEYSVIWYCVNHNSSIKVKEQEY